MSCLRCWLGFLAFVLPCWGAATMHPLVVHGPSSNRLNIVVMAEGYTTNQFNTFTNQAQVIVGKLLKTIPYSNYSNYFNAYAIYVPSNDSGSDHPPGLFRDTYFNSTYNSHGIDRLITIPPNNWDAEYDNGRGKLDALLEEFMPEYDIVLLLVNDPEYGGSGGAFAVASVHASSAEIAIHEIGHFAGLGDEYESPAPGYPETEDPNTTKETRREFIKWREWIDPSTPVPTPESPDYASVIGLFEGAHYHSTGWYRPKLDCKMRTLGRQFCEVCRETLILYQYRQINMVDDRSPAATNVTIWPGSTLTFNVIALQPSLHSLSMQWSLDGVPLPGANASSFTLDGNSLSPGIHDLVLDIQDVTASIRNDPLSRAREQTRWRVQVLENQPEIVSPPPEVTEDGLRLEFTTSFPAEFILEDSTDLVSWMPILTNKATTRFSVTNAIPFNDPHRFFRVELRPQK